MFLYVSMKLDMILKNVRLLSSLALQQCSIVIEFLSLFRILPLGSGFPICLGIDRSIARCDDCRRITCILCQEDEDVTANGQALVCAAFMQK